MHFYVSCFSTVASIVLVLHLVCFTTNVTAQKISFSLATDSSEDYSETTVQPNDEAYTNTRSSPQMEIAETTEGTDTELADSTVVPTSQGFAVVPERHQPAEEVVYHVKKVPSGSQWVQKIQSAKSRSLEVRLPSVPNSSQENLPSGKQLWFGQILSSVIYANHWSASDTNPSCAKDMETYHMHMQNMTLWATKSKRLFFEFILHSHRLPCFGNYVI